MKNDYNGSSIFQFPAAHSIAPNSSTAFGEAPVGPIDIRHAEQFDSIGRLRLTAIMKTHTLCDTRILYPPTARDGAMHILRTCCGVAVSRTQWPRPARSLISCLCKCTNTQLFNDAAQLTRDNLKSLTRLTLLKVSPMHSATGIRPQTCAAANLRLSRSITHAPIINSARIAPTNT